VPIHRQSDRKVISSSSEKCGILGYNTFLSPCIFYRRMRGPGEMVSSFIRITEKREALNTPPDPILNKSPIFANTRPWSGLRLCSHSNATLLPQFELNSNLSFGTAKNTLDGQISSRGITIMTRAIREIIGSNLRRDNYCPE
jgi:hypothetical protein